jgi:hypothetical protein
MTKYRITVGIKEPPGSSHVQASIQEKRKRIFRARYDSSIVSECFSVQEVEGLSGEELMTIIAYHALVALERTWVQYLDVISTRAQPNTKTSE